MQTKLFFPLVAELFYIIFASDVRELFDLTFEKLAFL